MDEAVFGSSAMTVTHNTEGHATVRTGVNIDWATSGSYYNPTRYVRLHDRRVVGCTPDSTGAVRLEEGQEMQWALHTEIHASARSPANIWENYMARICASNRAGRVMVTVIDGDRQINYEV